jgi:hypothetical protein
MVLKARGTMPKAKDIDDAVTLQGLLDKKEPSDWSTSKAAAIEGYVVQLEEERDGSFTRSQTSGLSSKSSSRDC